MTTSNKKHVSEDELLRLLRNKNSKGLEYLYDHYSAALYGAAYRIVQNKSFAEEVLQDAFVNVWKKIDSYDATKGRLFTWLVNIVRNKAIDKVRSAEVRKENKSDSFIDHVSSIDRGNSYEQSTDAIGLQDVLASLDEKERFVLEMIYYKGYTHAELAKEYDMPLGTVKTRLRKAILTLRQRIRIN
ncbi:RNA polymerase subunit sigma-70 [Reichenbachiella sp. 5M10]|uniref:RNA polymerase sigma factor n=1 Tax=Reichenbachiella sp. 5M10 TaxID=1889772 RepID=UPI000C158176|nr:sigma-70 family RNA polymerase sigma factor [Reichenbachiella sp. 5M10]PIB37090.1 RNA polymerase subunit sigma-70 [Reichenbachiella sp. 5M10]